MSRVRKSPKSLPWLIRGFDSTSLIFERTVDGGQLTDDQIKALLRALTAKAGLTYDEIVGAYAKRRTKIANNLLEIRKNSPYPTYECGTNPHFIASVPGVEARHVKGDR